MTLQTILYRDEHLWVTPDMFTIDYTRTRVPWEYWVCSQGLVLWTNSASPALRHWADGKPAGVPGTTAYAKGFLLTLEGDLYHIEITLKNGVSAEDDERYCRLLATGPGVSWSYALNADCAEAGNAALLLGKDLAHVKELMIKADNTMAKIYEWYKVSDLVAMTKEIHRKKYFHLPMYDEERKQALAAPKPPRQPRKVVPKS